MRKILFAFILVLSLSTHAQNSIIGSWKVALVYNDYVYYDVKKDSIDFKMNLDSDNTGSDPNDHFNPELVKTKFAEVYRLEMRFTNDGKYQVIHNDNDSNKNDDIEGVFTVDTVGKFIRITAKESGGKEISINYKYSFHDDRLLLVNHLSNGTTALAMELEKF